MYVNRMFQTARKRAAQSSPRQISLMTFNILAPCYFRHGGLLESDFEQVYVTRAQEIVQFIHKQCCDVICLQEYWFNQSYERIFHSAFQHSHTIHTIKRPGIKQDGLAILVNKQKLDIQFVNPIQAGDRVAMMMHLTLKQPYQSFLLINSHLTFPHGQEYKEIRLSQIQLVLNSVQGYMEQHNLQVPVLLCGDFNDHNDPVHQKVLDNGYRSVFEVVHGREARITHCNHKNREVGVDFIFASGLSTENGKKSTFQLYPLCCDLLPRHLPDTARLKRPSFGHDWSTIECPLEMPLEQCKETHEQLVDYWSLLSDHRPLLAIFDARKSVLS